MVYVVIRDPRSPMARNGPTVVHQSRTEAEAEAKRLAEANRGVYFFVAEVKSGAVIPKEQATLICYDAPGNIHDNPLDDDIPF